MSVHAYNVLEKIQKIWRFFTLLLLPLRINVHATLNGSGEYRVISYDLFLSLVHDITLLLRGLQLFYYMALAGSLLQMYITNMDV